jgi:hypothetical protein
MQVQRKLRVYPLWREDVFKDIARIPEQQRGGIREGSVCTVSANGCTKQLIVRGLEEALADGITLDEITRKAMGNLQEGLSYDFAIKEAGVWGQIKWACLVADRGPRIPATIARTLFRPSSIRETRYHIRRLFVYGRGLSLGSRPRVSDRKPGHVRVTGIPPLRKEREGVGHPRYRFDNFATAMHMSSNTRASKSDAAPAACWISGIRLLNFR